MQPYAPRQTDPLASPIGRIKAIWEHVLRTPVGPDGDFFALGGTAAAQRTAARLGRMLGLPIDARTIARHPTPRDLANVLRRIPAPPQVNTQWLQERVEQALERVPANEGTLAASRGRGSVSKVLLTGATGFLGARLLHELLYRTDAHIVCLVRARDSASGLRRILDGFADQGLRSVPRLVGRVSVACGDITEPCLGVGVSVWSRWSRELDTIYHCAQTTGRTHSSAGLWPANVEGALEVARLAMEGRPKLMHHASTLAARTGCDDRQLGKRERRPGPRRVFGGYPQTKWSAESALRRLACRGLNLRIYRLAHLVGERATGIGGRKDFLSRLINGIARIGAMPEHELKFNLVPVDYAAAAIAHISSRRSEESASGVFHLASPRPVRLGDLLPALACSGRPMRTVGVAEFEKLAMLAAETLSPHVPDACSAVVRGIDASDSLVRADVWNVFESGRGDHDHHCARSALRSSGLVCPSPDRVGVARYVRAALAPGRPV